MGLAPAAVVPRSDGEARVFLKDTVPDEGRALGQYRAVPCEIRRVRPQALVGGQMDALMLFGE